MSSDAGDPVFNGDIDEILAGKIIRHTESSTGQNSAQQTSRTDAHDTSPDAAHEAASVRTGTSSRTSRHTTVKNLLIITGCMALIMLFLLSLCSTKPDHHKRPHR
jgi:hypothetical protein